MADDTLKPLTDEQIDKLLSELNVFAIECDNYEYGLPIGDAYAVQKMREIVRRRLAQICEAIK